uniref:Lipocalin/cytosolic fatty-acid binding domain-containing protein n=1 Tax=Felis catus TaxID=9685 RepID=A0ABI7YRJ0_FELCA
MPPNLTGYYRFVSQKNMEHYLQALNIGMALRKIALLLKPDKEIDHQGNHVVVKTLSTFRNYILEFDVGVEFEEDLRIVDGRKCQRETEHERGRVRERGRHRIGNRLQAPSHQPRARRGARTHGPRDRDLAEVGRLTDCATQAPHITIVTWEEEQLVCVQKGEVPNRGWRHWLEGETLYLELTARDAVCEQVFRKVK